jgi:hypothetical protein
VPAGGCVPLTTIPIGVSAGTAIPLAEHVCGVVVELAAAAIVHDPSAVPGVPTWLVMLDVTGTSEKVRLAIGMNDEILKDAVQAVGASTRSVEL